MTKNLRNEEALKALLKLENHQADFIKNIRTLKNLSDILGDLGNQIMSILPAHIMAKDNCYVGFKNNQTNDVLEFLFSNDCIIINLFRNIEENRRKNKKITLFLPQKGHLLGFKSQDPLFQICGGFMSDGLGSGDRRLFYPLLYHNYKDELSEFFKVCLIIVTEIITFSELDIFSSSKCIVTPA